MYCARCGVELQRGVKRCPLCGLEAWHPELEEEPEAPPYPRHTGGETVSHSGLLFIVSFVFLLPLVISLMIDLNMNRAVTWSGYVCFGLLTAYTVFCLPLWFSRPNPVIFFPVSMAAALGLCLYIAVKTGGEWFLPFAFPVGGALLLVVETVLVLMRYALGGKRHRALFVIGGAFMALGGLCLLLEFLLKVAFGIAMRFWSLYALAALFLLGLMLLIIGLCRPLRTSLQKKFFI